MEYKVFFADYCEGKILDSKDARYAPLDEILHSMDCVLHMPNNFLGIIDADDATLQFMVCDDKQIFVDIPQTSRKGSLTKTISLAECLDLVRNMGPLISAVDTEGMNFQS